MPQGFSNGDWEGRPRHTGLKVTMIVVFVLVLIAASVYIVRSDTGLFWDWDFRSIGWDFSFSDLFPSANGADDVPRDYRDAMGELFALMDTGESGSRMERVEGNSEAGIVLVSAGEREELSLQELYLNCIDSIVGVKSYYEDRSGYGWGSGIVMSEDGYILTNQHMVDSAVRAVVVLSDDREYEALLVGEDEQTDLAILKIGARDLQAAEFGDSDELCTGDRVAAIGNPLGSNLSGTMTDGIISAINRDVMLNGRRMTLLQTNAAINSGSSGGALVNMYGQIVGVTFMKMAGVSTEGLGFAIPSATVKAVTDQLLSGGAVAGRPGLGLTLGGVTEAMAEYYGVPRGVYVFAVAPECDAAAKGVLPGDIVMKIDGKEVRGTSDVLGMRDALSVGDIMTLTIWRDGAVLDVDVVLVDQSTLSY